jgi:transcriptional regulator with XRE-family HTH domain
MVAMAAKTLPAFAKRLRDLRDAAGLTQQEMGTKAGLSISNLAQLEQGQKSDPRLSTILALARALGVKPSKLVDGLTEA